MLIILEKVPGSSGMGVINAVEDGSVYACIVRGANFEGYKGRCRQCNAYS